MKRHILLLALTNLLSCSVITAKHSRPKPEVLPEELKNDSGSMFPDGDYRNCCIDHDKTHYFGGTGKQRLRADNALYKCVAHQKGLQHMLLAPLMWVGVRIGGAGYLPTPFRWGFGEKTQKK